MTPEARSRPPPRPRVAAVPRSRGQSRPTCGGRPTLGSRHPGAAGQLVLKQLLVEAIFRGVAAHQDQGQATTGSQGVASHCR